MINLTTKLKVFMFTHYVHVDTKSNAKCKKLTDRQTDRHTMTAYFA